MELKTIIQLRNFKFRKATANVLKLPLSSLKGLKLRFQFQVLPIAALLKRNKVNE